MSRMKNLLWLAGYVLTPGTLVLVSALFLSGCSLITETSRNPPIQVWPDMRKQEKFLPQSAVQEGGDLSKLFADGRSNRPRVEGTIARGHLRLDEPGSTGMVNATTYTGKNPLPLTEETLRLGQTRFNVYCAPCHDRTGSGQGIVNKREPTYKPGNLLEERIRGLADGEIFFVLTNGRRTMPAYRFQVAEKDRWAIIYYVRALQRAATGTLTDVPEDKKATLN
jgi:mono/diheme cytochrome c family protein